MKLIHGISVSAFVVAMAMSNPAQAQDRPSPTTPQSGEKPTTTAASNEAQPAAPSTQDQGLEDIVVTAQRRSENLQNAALAVTAVTGKTLETKGITSIADIARLTPSLGVSQSNGPYQSFAIRGITQFTGNAFADPSVAVFIDGVYLASSESMTGLFYDLDRVEVLPGPQGTLYGRNATSGAVNIYPRRPTFDLGGYLSADVGNYNQFNLQGALNIPLGDKVAFRVAGQRLRHDGYFSDGTDDEESVALRTSLLYKPTEKLSIVLTGDYSNQGGKGAGGTIRRQCSTLLPTETPHNEYNGACFVAPPWTGIADLPQEYTRFLTNAGTPFAVQTKNPHQDNNYYGLTLNADWITNLGTFTLIGGYRKVDTDYYNSDLSWQLDAVDHPEQGSVELRLASDGDKRLKYVFGAFYLTDSDRSRQISESAKSRTFGEQDNDVNGQSAALFSQLTYSLTQRFRVTGGLRYTHESKSSDSARYTLTNLVGPDPIFPPRPTGNPALFIKGTKAWNKVNWKAGVEFDATSHNLLYANVSTGFKAGGFFYGPPPTTGSADSCAGSCVYQPETVTAYVLGSKNTFLDNRLRLNLEAFYTDLRNQQQFFVTSFNGVPTSVTQNIARSRIYGLEAEAEVVPFPNTRISGQVQYLNSKYLDFVYLSAATYQPPAYSACKVTAATAATYNVDCTGLPGLRSPKWRAMASIEQTVPLKKGKVVAEVDGRYESSSQGDPNYIPETESYPTTRLNANLTYYSPNERFSIGAYVSNITNVVTITSEFAHNVFATTGIVAAALAPPRTFGVRAKVTF